MAAHHEPTPVHEVQDMADWVFFEFLFGEPKSWHLPKILGIQITKFMILELIAAGLILLIYIPLARRIRQGGLPRGRFWNFFEGVLTFIRDEVARPNLDIHHSHGHGAEGHGFDDAGPTTLHEQKEMAKSGHHPADQFVPFLWTLFLFILFCNLMGMFPMMGSPTASIWVTGGLALIVFVLLHAVPIAKVGLVPYLKSLWPKIEMPPGAVFQVMGILFTIMIGLIEIMGMFIKSGVLAVRLFANMFAGHMVLANILFFIYVVGKTTILQGQGHFLWGGVTVASIIGVVGLSLLELFVGFLQAYIFTFLTALFIGMNLQHAVEH